MPPIDTKQREKWPAPKPGPDHDYVETELDKAREESATDPLRAKARAVLALLREAYGEPEWPVLDPLGTLIETMLSHRTADPQTWSAYQELRKRFPTWEEVMNAPVEEVDDAIHATTFHEQKAPRIQAVLKRVKEEHGSFDLSFLDKMPLDEANEWLQSLGGVGPKTAACVLLFACKRPVLPVDTHVHRVSIRLGLIPANTDANAAHPLILSLLPDPNNEQDVLAFHRDMLLHGQRICVWAAARVGRLRPTVGGSTALAPVGEGRPRPLTGPARHSTRRRCWPSAACRPTADRAPPRCGPG